MNQEKFLMSINRFSRIAPLFCALVLQSCFVAKKYTRPDVVNSAYFRTDSLSQDSVSMAVLSWRELFRDPILVSYIEKGLENNVDIRIALQQIAAARAYYLQGKAGI